MSQTIAIKIQSSRRASKGLGLAQGQTTNAEAKCLPSSLSLHSANCRRMNYPRLVSELEEILFKALLLVVSVTAPSSDNSLLVEERSRSLANADARTHDGRSRTTTPPPFSRYQNPGSPGAHFPASSGGRSGGCQSSTRAINPAGCCKQAAAQQTTSAYEAALHGYCWFRRISSFKYKGSPLSRSEERPPPPPGRPQKPWADA